MSETTTDIKSVLVPDLGGAKQVQVIEILVKPGDIVALEDPLMTMESDKASMDIPAPFAGKVLELKVRVGDKVSEGTEILIVEPEGELYSINTNSSLTTKSSSENSEQQTEESSKKSSTSNTLVLSQKDTLTSSPLDEISESITRSADPDIYAGPGARRLAREYGLNLQTIAGSGHKGRITQKDVEFVAKDSGQMQMQTSNGRDLGFTLAPRPIVDFAAFGEVSIAPLNRIKKLTGAFLHRNWVQIPHVTQFEEADITELEAFRQANKAEMEREGVKLTPLVFIMKAVIAALSDLPNFNSSLSEDGENLVIKHYYHLGVAVDTPNGLVVPVIRDVDQKSLRTLAQELAAISQKAREKGLQPRDMQGGCFSISSLGGIGGTAFTPIVNSPEVAILGVAKSSYKPVYENGEFVPRLMLPLSLSYDHRVIDGAEAARFCQRLAFYLSDVRRLLI